MERARLLGRYRRKTRHVIVVRQSIPLLLASRPMNHRNVILVLLVTVFNLLSLPANASPESDFWKWFQSNEALLFDFEQDQERIFDEVLAEMHKVDSSLTFEFGPKSDGRREFVISADGNKDAFPKVESLYASAPKLPKWILVKFRPRREPFDIEYGGIAVKAETVLVRLEPEGDKADITMYIPGYSEMRRDSFLPIAYLMLDQALGEHDVEMRVGTIEVQDAPSDRNGLLSLAQLPKAFDALLAEP